MRIVIVEDHPLTLNVLSMALQAVEGYEVQSFATAREGLVACAAGADLAIFDNQLPDLSGTEAVEHLRADAATRHLPVIIITGDSDRRTRLAAIRSGATDFLEKPVRVDELRIRVRNLLALHTAQKEARAGQTLLETLIAAAGTRVAVADASQPGAPILYASDPLRSHVGPGRGDLKGQPLSTLWADAPPSPERRALETAVALCEPGRFVLTDPLGGGVGWAEITLSPVAQSGDPVRYLVASVTDVTDLVETRQAHARLSSRLSDIARISGAWFFEMDADLRLSYVSAAMAQALGGQPEKLLGLPLGALPVRLADPGRKGTPVSALFAPPHQPLEQVMLTFRLPDASICAVQINASPFFDDQGRFAGYRGHAGDVSQIIRARDQAAQASRAKSVFLATMSHEMRTPLTAIVGLAEIAARDDLPEGLRGQLDEIRAQALRLSDLLSDVLDVAAMEQGKAVLNSAPFDPVTVAQAAAAPAQQTAAARGLEFGLQIPAPRAGARLGDGARFAGILRALVSNAVKFTPHGRVAVRLDLSDPAEVGLTVTDTGIGMTEAEQAAALLPFVQNDDGIARRFEGAGLGLSIVTWLTEAMGGRFALTSKPGEGTRVEIRLPLPEVGHPPPVARPAAVPGHPAPTGPAAGPPAAPPVRADLAGRRVLVADDNLTNRKILQAMLSRMGAQVTLCEDGAEAIEAWHRKDFDLVLLDINMPRMAGTEVVQAIRDHETASGSAPVPALAVTANARPDQVALYRRVGFDGCVAKPFTSAQLAEKLSRHIESPAR